MKSAAPRPRILPAGESALVVEFGDAVDEGINGAVTALDAAIGAAGLPGIVETVPSYRSLLVYYDPVRYGFAGLARRLMRLAKRGVGSVAGPRRIFVVPVRYGGEWGPDLEDVARHTGLDPEAVISRHSAVDYRIYMLGFLPGFAYLGGLDPSLETPRLETPRQRIRAGSVGIAGAQTGIYPLESPGGWRLIGTTPLRLYDPRRSEPIPYRPGDYIRFRPVGDEDFEELRRRADAGEAVWG